MWRGVEDTYQMRFLRSVGFRGKLNKVQSLTSAWIINIMHTFLTFLCQYQGVESWTLVSSFTSTILYLNQYVMIKRPPLLVWDADMLLSLLEGDGLFFMTLVNQFHQPPDHEQHGPSAEPAPKQHKPDFICTSLSFLFWFPQTVSDHGSL